MTRLYYSIIIDLTDYSLTYFRMSGADKDYIPMFSCMTNLFLAVLRLTNKVIFNPTKHKTLSKYLT